MDFRHVPFASRPSGLSSAIMQIVEEHRERLWIIMLIVSIVFNNYRLSSK